MVEDRLLSVAETALILGIAPATLYSLSSRGTIPRTKIGGSLKFRESDVRDLIQRRTTYPPGWDHEGSEQEKLGKVAS